MTDPLPPGSQVRGYQVRRGLRSGGMALLYEAFSAGQGRRAAIKVLRPGTGPEIAARFANEARATNRVHHHHPGCRGVVTLYETGQLDDNTPYIIMEYLDGDRLQDRLHRAQGCADAHHLQLLSQVARTLASAHAAGVVHRDVKPDNIMVVPEQALPGGERAVLIDFGIAKLPQPERAEDGTLTQAHSFLGSSHYAAPEQRLSPESVDGKADVYALGVVLYYLCTGRRPFQGPESEVVMLHLTQPPPRPRVRALPRSLSGLTVAMLAKEPAARPAMDRVAALLQQAAAQAAPEEARRSLLNGMVLGLLALAGVVFASARSRPVLPAQPDLIARSPADLAPPGRTRVDLGPPTALVAPPRLSPRPPADTRRSGHRRPEGWHGVPREPGQEPALDSIRRDRSD